MNIKFCILSLILTLPFFSCKKKLEDTLIETPWKYESSYTYRDEEGEKTINKTGEITFLDNSKGVQIESGKTFNFYWNNSESLVTLEYDPSPYENNQIQEYMAGGYISYQININEEKKQEWSGEAIYMVDSDKRYQTSIKIKLTK